MKTSKFINRLFAVNLIFLLLCQLVLAQTMRADLQLSRDGDNSDSAKRIALVIGNAAYTSAKPLPNPANDADDVAAALKTLGFEVFSGTNQNKRQIETLIRQFGKRLAETKGTGLFYYAGHGVQVNGENFLVPVNAEIPEEVDVRYAAVSMNYVLDNMRWAENDLNLIILDACRNNPFARSWTRKRAADEDKGLARISPPQGTVVMYATQPGATADDGKGRNGLFTSVLLKEIKKPNVELDSMIKAVTRGVLDASKALSKTQYPWREGSYVGDFYFASKGAGNTAAKPETSKPAIDDNDPNFGTGTDAKTVEREVFRSIQNSTDIAEIRAVLEEYANSQFAAGARLKLEQLVWNSVKDSKDKAKIQAYLDEFKTGANAPFARVKLRQLETPTATNAAPPMSNPPAKVSAARLAAGESHGKNQYGMEFVFIPAGGFEMGSEKGYENEMPARRIKITKDFEMMKTEVTQGQWEAVMKTTLRQQRDKWEARLKTLTQQELNKALSERNTKMVKRLEESKEHLDKMYQIRGEGSDYPMYFVSWDEARGFVQALNSLNDGYKYRLPTEAEWEYAARAGTTGDYAGSLDSIGWYCANSGNTVINGKDCSDKKLTALNSQSHPVGQKQPNAWNLYDMHGNVQEWTADWFGEYNPSDISDPTGAASGRSHVVRGGCWSCGSKVLRSAARNISGPDNKTGFRVVRTAL